MQHFQSFLLVILIIKAKALRQPPEDYDILHKDIESVYRMTEDVSMHFKCECIVVMYPDSDNRKKSEEILLDKIAASIAKGTYRPVGRPPISIMLYNSSQYKEYYMTDRKKHSGTCFKWLNIVLLSYQTYKEISAIASTSPNEFAQAIWLAFPVVRIDPSRLPLAFNSKFLMVAAHAAGKITIFSSRKNRGMVLGHWTTEKGLEMTAEQDYDMTGVNIRYIGTEIWPMVSYSQGSAGQEHLLDGYFARVFYELAEVLNYSHTCISGPSGLGTYKKNELSGAFGMAIEGKVDVIISDADMTAERVENFDFSLPLIYSHIEVYYKEGGQVFEWFAMLKPFDSFVWLLIALSLLIGNIAYNYFKFKILEASDSLEEFELDFPLLRAMCFQGSWSVPTATPLRLLFWTGYLMAAILFPAYSASLISSLTDRAPYAPFESVDQVLNTKYKLIIPTNSSVEEYFTTHPNPKIREIRDKHALLMNYTNTEVASHLTFINYMCARENVALVGHSGPITQIQLSNVADCKFTKLSRPVTRLQQSLLFPKHSPYRAAFNVILLKKRESGCLKKFEKQYLNLWPKRRLREEIFIEYRDVAGIILLFAIGVGLSVVIAILECIHKNY